MRSPSRKTLGQNRLWGLLVANHCSDPRQWQQWEMDFLKQLAAQVAIAIQQSELYRQLEIANQKLHYIAITDGLTGIANRRRFDEVLVAEWRRLATEQAPLSIILCDIDFFKLYNDRYGHLAGDICLQQIAHAIAISAKRPADLVARYGGEEFAAILPRTDAAGASIVAQAIRAKIKKLKIPHAKSPINQYVTLSLGIATTIPCCYYSSDTLIKAADTALYKAKNLGRDRVVVAS